MHDTNIAVLFVSVAPSLLTDVTVLYRPSRRMLVFLCNVQLWIACALATVGVSLVSLGGMLPPGTTGMNYDGCSYRKTIVIVDASLLFCAF